MKNVVKQMLGIHDANEKRQQMKRDLWLTHRTHRVAFLADLVKNGAKGKAYSDAVVAWDKETGENFTKLWKRIENVV